MSDFCERLARVLPHRRDRSADVELLDPFGIEGMGRSSLTRGRNFQIYIDRTRGDDSFRENAFRHRGVRIGGTATRKAESEKEAVEFVSKLEMGA